MFHVSKRVYPAVRDMRAGKLFRAVNDYDRILALLTNSHVSVSDVRCLWCVVVAASPESGALPGTLMPLPFDALVVPLRVEQPVQLSEAA